MKQVTDYIDFIARSMMIKLTNRQKRDIANWIINNDKYIDFLHDLEKVIIETNKNIKIIKFRR